MSTPTPLVFSTDVPLRWGDMDAQGHVNNARFVDYLQEARADFLLSGPCAQLLGGGVVVASHQVEYTAPIVFSSDPVRIDLAVTAVGAAKFSLAYRISHAGLVCARARTLLCPFDFAAGTPARLEAPERAWLRSLVTDVEPLRDQPLATVGDRGMATPLRVRWADLDSYGHVNNTVFFDYVQEGRITFSTAASAHMARAGGSGPVERVWLVVRQDVRYLHQLAFRREPYEVSTAVQRVGRTSMTFASEVRDPDGTHVYARAATVVVSADEHLRPEPIPREWIEALAPYTL